MRVRLVRSHGVGARKKQVGSRMALTLRYVYHQPQTLFPPVHVGYLNNTVAKKTLEPVPRHWEVPPPSADGCPPESSSEFRNTK